MAASNTSLEENLRCSICLDIFKDPVVLHCSHSFCKACLESIWIQKELKKCPLCRKTSKHSPFQSIALKNACESFVVEKKRKVSPLIQGAVCLDHAEKQQMFCITDQKLVCMQCVNLDHQDHNFSTISKVASEHKTLLQKPLQKLQASLQRLTSKKSEYGCKFGELKGVAQKTEKQIREDFQKLHQFLREEETASIIALKKKEEEKMKRMTEGMKEIEALCSALSEQIQKLQEDMTGDDSLFLNNFKDIEERAVYNVPDSELDLGALLDFSIHRLNLRHRLYEKMKNITLGPPGRIPLVPAPYLCSDNCRYSICYRKACEMSKYIYFHCVDEQVHTNGEISHWVPDQPHTSHLPDHVPQGFSEGGTFNIVHRATNVLKNLL